MFASKILVVLFANLVLQSTYTARILGITPSLFYSHSIVFQPLWKELSLRGHQLTVLTTEPINDTSLTNLTEISLRLPPKTWETNVLEMIANSQGNFLKAFDILLSTTAAVMSLQLQHPQVRALLENQTEHFDLLIVHFLMPTMLSFSARFKCPFIGISPFDPPAIVYDAIGNPNHPVLNPDVNIPFAGRMTFKERLISTAFEWFLKFYANVYIAALIDGLVNKHFGEHYPRIADTASHMSMLLVKPSPIINQIRPLVPSVVQVGRGILRRTLKLPENLQVLLDEATQGVIYFSLGTNIKSKQLSNSTQRILLETFAELPFLVFWKSELEVRNMLIKPKNIVHSKWFPQQDILKHPNMALFITHGGQQSIEEGLHGHIPMIGIPFFGDQLANVKYIVDKGVGLTMDFNNLIKETLKKTILEVINNPKYRNEVKKLADLLTDQPMTGLERAVWWTEYVLRHKGATHWKSPIPKITFYQYFLLDVIGFCIVTILLVTYLWIVFVRLLCRLVKYYISTQ